MSFVEAWKQVRDSVVAICPLFYEEQREFPVIIGTGFLISTEGVVCTCRHVADAFAGLFRPPEFTGIPAVVLLFRHDPENPAMWGTVPLRIEAIGSATVTGDLQSYRGPIPPDLAYLRLDTRETPALAIAGDQVEEGETVAFGGFPMGDNLLMAPGWLHHLAPTIHSGIVAAILPIPGHPTPHGFWIHANTQGGSSGSPVFREDGRLVGMVYSGMSETNRVLTEQGRPTDLIVPVPTSLTGCVSRELLAQSCQGAHDAAAVETNRPTLAQRIANATRHTVARGEGTLDVWDPSRHNR